MHSWVSFIPEQQKKKKNGLKRWKWRRLNFFVYKSSRQLELQVCKLSTCVILYCCFWIAVGCFICYTINPNFSLLLTTKYYRFEKSLTIARRVKLWSQILLTDNLLGLTDDVYPQGSFTPSESEREFFLVFVTFSLIFFDWSLIFFVFTASFTLCE